MRHYSKGEGLEAIHLLSMDEAYFYINFLANDISNITKENYEELLTRKNNKYSEIWSFHPFHKKYPVITKLLNLVFLKA